MHIDLLTWFSMSADVQRKKRLGKLNDGNKKI